MPPAKEKVPSFPAPPPDRLSWVAPDGKPMPYSRWPAEVLRVPRQPESVIICTHGLSGAASDFRALGERFGDGGSSVVYAVELRGQGNDPDMPSRGDIRSASQWIEDLLAFTRQVREHHPGAPVFWYGESLGALIALHALAEAPTRAATAPPVAGLILASPVTSIRSMPPKWKIAAVRTLMRLAPGMRISLESLGNREARKQKVTSTTTHREQMEKTPHYVETFTFRLFHEVERMIRTSAQAGATIDVPLLVLYTPNDVFTSRKGVERFFDAAGPADKTRLFYPDSFHLILHDKDREAALQALRQWTRQRIPPGRTPSGK